MRPRIRHGLGRAIFAGVCLIAPLSLVHAGSLEGTWSDLIAKGIEGQPIVYDAAHERLVAFGGQQGWGGPYLGDLRAFDLKSGSGWLSLAANGAPPSARGYHSAILDPVRNRMLVFGGIDSNVYRNDVWALSLAGTPTWTQLAPLGTKPTGRASHTAVYDAARDRMLVFGGSASGPTANDVWALSLGGTPTWTPLAPAGTPPTPRYGAAAVYDPARDRVVLYGGDSGNISQLPRETWALQLSSGPTWIQLPVENLDLVGRVHSVAIYDPIRDRMVLHAGAGPGLTPKSDTWTLDLDGTSAWTSIAVSGLVPGARLAHGGTYDAEEDRLVVFGGRANSARDDVWALSLSNVPSWNPLLLSSPPGRQSHTAIYDPSRDRMIVFGGVNKSPDGGSPPSYFTDVWSLTLGSSPQWSSIDAAGSLPPPRSEQAAVYDPWRDRMLVFGGFDGVSVFADLWSLTFASEAATWTRIQTAQAPPARRGHTLVYDRVRDRCILFGGTDGVTHFDDIWILDLTPTATWTQVSGLWNAPAWRIDHTAIVDVEHDRMVLFGGRHPTLSLAYDDLYTLSLQGPMIWTQIIPTGSRPHNRYGHSALYDPGRQTMVVFGGQGGETEVWSLNLNATLTWSTPLLNTPQGHLHTAIYDPSGDRMVSFGGHAYPFDSRDTPLTLTWGQATDAAPSAATNVWLSQNRPNPFNPTTRIEFELAVEAVARLEIFDAKGRLVRSLLRTESLSPGTHRVEWDGRDEAGRTVASGVYLYRLHAGDRIVARRMQLVK